MTEPIKGCPQPDPPELVMRADGYHYRTEDETKELTDEDLDRLMKENVPTAVRCPPGWRNAFRAAIDADRALNAEDHGPLEPKRLESIADPTLRAVCETYTNTPGGHFVRLQAIAKLVPAPADRDVMRQVPAGWKWVPVEPTEEMIEEGRWYEGEHTARSVWRDMLAAAPTPPAEQQGKAEYPAGEVIGPCVCGSWPGGECFNCPKVEQEPIIYKRSEFTKNWTTFNVRREHADAAEARLRAPSLTALRAKMEALPRGVNQLGAMYIILDDVLAEIDKMGGKV